MAQAIARNHHQVLRRILHHHLHFLIRVKKGSQVLKKKKQNLLVFENQTVQFPKQEGPVLAE
jgi:23S rRNA maturation-related 3'-5' exoribonuclease YhaM